MVAYSFQDRWAADVEEGRKVCTIRARRKGRSRHARVGERVQLLYRPSDPGDAQADRS